MKTTTIIILLILAFAAGIVAAVLLFSPAGKTDLSVKADKYIFRDTLIRLVPQPAIKIYKVKTKVIKLKDTVIQSYPFTAKLDTIILRDTIKAEFAFPQNTLSLELLKKPDTLKTERITLQKTIEKEKPWWETPVCIAGGILTGIIIRSAIK